MFTLNKTLDRIIAIDEIQGSQFSKLMEFQIIQIYKIKKKTNFP
jgi:hypothetical protein